MTDQNNNLKNQIILDETIIENNMNRVYSEKQEVQNQIISCINDLILPLMEELYQNVPPEKRFRADLLRIYLENFLNSFGKTLSLCRQGMTKKEIEICGLIQYGMTNKEIAKLLNISTLTVHTHRNQIRKKLGLKKSSKNLYDYLNDSSKLAKASFLKPLE